MVGCRFGFQGTFGHECGAKPTQVAVKKSDRTVSGLYYGLRCDRCASIRGGDNDFVIRFEPYTGQTNVWK